MSTPASAALSSATSDMTRTYFLVPNPARNGQQQKTLQRRARRGQNQRIRRSGSAFSSRANAAVFPPGRAKGAAVGTLQIELCISLAQLLLGPFCPRMRDLGTLTRF